MADDVPSRETAVPSALHTFSWALMFGSVDCAIAGKWPLSGLLFLLAICCHMLSANWPTLKAQMPEKQAQRLERIALRPWLRRILSALGVLFLVVGGYYAYSLRSTLNSYILPRSVTNEQRLRLKEYLDKQQPFAVHVEVVPNDPEAMEYAGQIFNALRDTNLDVNPPNHGGVESVQIPGLPEPKLTDKDPSGRPLYRDMNAFMEAEDQWIKYEVGRQVAERTYPDTGLGIHVRLTGQPVNPDPHHPTNESILADAFKYAGILVTAGGGEYSRSEQKIWVLVGHRPMRTEDSSSILAKLGGWLESIRT